MRFINSLVPGLMLLATITSQGQTTAVPAADPTALVEAPARRVLVKIGLNAARPFRHGGYYGLLSRLPLSAGLEYSLNPRFTLYGQAVADRAAPRYDSYREIRNPWLPSGALSLGARYYYNQAGRAQHKRAHGPFIGNYLAVEAHTERMSYVSYNASPYPALGGSYENHYEYATSLNLLWGMQRRLSRSFLFDLNAGIGLSPKRSDAHFGGYSAGALNLSSQINLGIYFGR
jgi:hypothetical protein